MTVISTNQKTRTPSAASTSTTAGNAGANGAGVDGSMVETDVSGASWYVEQRTKGKPTCYGAPYLCNGSSKKCQECSHHEECACLGISMVYLVASGEVVLDGVTTDKRGFVNKVGSFLSEDYKPPTGRPIKPIFETILACYARSKHLIPTDRCQLKDSPSEIERCNASIKLGNELDDLLAELDDAIKDGPLAKKCNPVKLPTARDSAHSLTTSMEDPSVSMVKGQVDGMEQTLPTTCSQSSIPSVISPALTGAAIAGPIDIYTADYRFSLVIVAPALATGIRTKERLRQLVAAWKMDRDYMATRQGCRGVNADGQGCSGRLLCSQASKGIQSEAV